MLLYTIIALRFHLNDIQAAAVDGGQIRIGKMSG